MKHKKVKELVLYALLNHPETRKDDFLLIRRVIAEANQHALWTSLNDALVNHLFYKMPSFESITRARRAIQKQHSVLKDPEMSAIRADEQQKYFEEYSNILK